MITRVQRPYITCDAVRNSIPCPVLPRDLGYAATRRQARGQGASSWTGIQPGGGVQAGHGHDGPDNRVLASD